MPSEMPFLVDEVTLVVRTWPATKVHPAVVLLPATGETADDWDVVASGSISHDPGTAQVDRVHRPRQGEGLDEPQPCPAYPGMTFDGLAVAPDGVQHFLVVTVRPPTKPRFRLYIGPDPQRVARRGLIVVAGLRTHGDPLAEPALGVSVLTWLAACWTEAASEIDHAIRVGR